MLRERLSTLPGQRQKTATAVHTSCKIKLRQILTSAYPTIKAQIFRLKPMLDEIDRLCKNTGKTEQ